jgi:manganese/zinc/iron transport system permease protein
MATLVALAVVVGLLAVGAILITALLIFPAVIARFWTNRFSLMVLLAGLCGAFMGGLGTMLSARFSFTPAAPLIVLIGTSMFIVSALFAPQRGAIAKLLANRKFSQLLADQRLLCKLWQSQRPATLTAGQSNVDQHSRRLSAQPAIAQAATRLVRYGLVRPRANDPSNATSWELTLPGRERAAQVVRGHELWRLALVNYPELARHCADLDMEAVDRLLPAAVVSELTAQLDADLRSIKPSRAGHEANA